VRDSLRPAGAGRIFVTRPGAAAAGLARREKDRCQPPGHQDEDDHGQDEDPTGDMDEPGSVIRCLSVAASWVTLAGPGNGQRRRRHARDQDASPLCAPV